VTEALFSEPARDVHDPVPQTSSCGEDSSTPV
jgi:hypothetical protein